MTLNIIAIILGGIFFGFGVAILVFRRYDLISGYTPQKGEEYARRMGCIQIVGGLGTAAGGVVGLLMNSNIPAYIGIFLGMGALILLGHFNDKT